MSNSTQPSGAVQFCGFLNPYSERGDVFGRNIGDFSTHLSQCEVCGYCRFDPLPPEAVLDSYYQEVYGAISGDVYDLQIHYDRPDLDGLADHIISTIRQYGYNGSDPLEVHDVGCAMGVLVYALRKNGVNATGTEINKEWVRLGNQFCDGALSHEAVGTYFKGSKRLLHFVSILHTLEHMPNPLNELLEVRLRLHREGIVYICVPNALFLPTLVFGKNSDENFTFPGHLHYFTPQSMLCLLRAAGLKILHLETRAGHFSPGGKDAFCRAATGLDSEEVPDEPALTRGLAENFRTAELHVIATRDDRSDVPTPSVVTKIQSHARYERPFWRRVDTALEGGRETISVLVTHRPFSSLLDWAPHLRQAAESGRLLVRRADEARSLFEQSALHPENAPARVIVDEKILGEHGDFTRYEKEGGWEWLVV